MARFGMGRSSVVVRSLLALAAVATVAGSAQTAQAAQWYPATMGVGLTSASQQCFSEYYGSETNTCSTWQYWIMPVVSNGAGNLTPSIWVYAPNTSGNVGCYAYGFQPISNVVFQSNTLYPSQIGVVTTVSPTGAWIDSWTFGQIICMVNPGGTVYGVNY